ncbi:MAG: hypothetical protein M3Q71_08760, partial [Chloroflexota bacterium]|nr:hypothetical protein [Chloroflexota bacterium]
PPLAANASDEFGQSGSDSVGEDAQLGLCRGRGGEEGERAATSCPPCGPAGQRSTTPDRYRG